MSQILQPTVISEIKVPGVSFQIADYQWEAGAALYDCASDVRLRWRVRPHRLKARGWVKPGEELSFGQMMLCPTDVVTHAQATDEAESSRMLDCWFDREWLGAITGVDIDWNDARLTSCLDLRNGDIDHAVRRLMREMVAPEFASNVLLESIGISIGVDIVRHFKLAHAGALDAKGVLSPGRLRHIREYVESFDEGSPTLADVANHTNISVAHLRRIYKLTTGQTMHSYIEEVRIRRAKMLLLDSNIPLKVISHRLGFCHPSAFSFAFKKGTGESPRAFRNRCSTGLTTVDD